MPEDTTLVRDLVDIPLRELQSPGIPAWVHNVLEGAGLRATREATTKKDRSVSFNSYAF